MKSSSLCFIIAFFSISIAFGQTKNDSINTYNKLKNWAVVKLTIAYMEDYKEWSYVNFKDDKKSSEKEKNTYKKLVEKYKAFPLDNIELDEVANTLSTGWVKTKDTVFERYKKELIDTDGIFSFEIVNYIPKGTTSLANRKKALDEIKYEYSNLIPNQQDRDLNYVNINKVSKKSFFQAYGIYALLIISIILNLSFYISDKSLKKKKSQNSSYNHEDYYKMENETLKKEISNLKSSTKPANTFSKKELVVKRDLAHLEQSTNSNDDNISNNILKADKVSNSDIENTISEEKSTTINLEINKSEINKKNKIYLKTPFEDKKFAAENAKLEKETNSLYIIEYDPISNKGVIDLIETANLEIALNSPNIYLEKVCDYQNAFTPQVKGINVVEKGSVILEGEDWLVTEKLKIKFI